MSNTNDNYENKTAIEELFYESGFRGENGEYTDWSKAPRQTPLTFLFGGRRNIADSPFISNDKVKGLHTKKPYRNLSREGWVFSLEQEEVGLREKFINIKTGTHFDAAGFDIIGVNADGITETGFDTATQLHTLTGNKYAPNGWNFFQTGGIINLR